MMTTMLVLTLITLIALFFVIKRLRPLSTKAVVVTEIKDANNNLNITSAMDDEGNESGLPLSSKNCYVTLVQHDDEQSECLCAKNSRGQSLTKRLSNTLADSQARSSPNGSLRFDKSSTNVLCFPDEQQRLSGDTSSHGSSHVS